MVPVAVQSTETFRVTCSDSASGARCGLLQTSHGEIRTPVFMPVGTQASVKSVSNQELTETGAQVILANAYHLYLRPGEKIIEEAGGLHAFMNWHKPLLTDSGGYQVFSLPTLNKIKNEGVEFQSHIDGSRHFLTPEGVIGLQDVFGSDILMPLDQCLPYPAERGDVERSLERTAEWAVRSQQTWKRLGESRGSLLFGIVQGGVFRDLRKKAARRIADMDFPGNAIGGLSVGEPNERMLDALNAALTELPADKPRYLMGVGMPMDLLDAVGQGVDMFDCVLPTRNGRNATVFTRNGKLLLRTSVFARDFRSIDENCRCYACRTYSRAYLSHLFRAEEYLAGRLASLHNLTFFIELLESAGQAIQQNRFLDFRREFERNYAGKTE